MWGLSLGFMGNLTTFGGEHQTCPLLLGPPVPFLTPFLGEGGFPY